MVEKICGKGEFLSLEWNSECLMEGESGEQVGGELESVTSLAWCFVQGWQVIDHLRGSAKRLFSLSVCFFC